MTEREGAAAGFRAAGVRAGIKPSGDLDLGLLVSDEPDTVSAARFTRSGVLAAPVVLCQERCRLDALRAVVVNSGNANAATGRRGLEDAARMQGAAAMAAGVHEDQVAVASTGVIGVPLPMDGMIARGSSPPAARSRRTATARFWRAIATTDAFEKRLALDVALPSGTVRVSAQAKGAGMIQPGFATMLCFVQTDAALQAETADLLLGVCVKRSFDRISVDGQLSTNDTAILMASGASGVIVEPGVRGRAAARRGARRRAAAARAADGARRRGRGARRRACTSTAATATTVERVARAVANSPLVKAALQRRRPELGPHRAGRRRRAAGHRAAAVRHLDRRRPGVRAAASRSRTTPPALGDEVEYVVGLPGEGAETEVFFSDLSHDYVRINAEYTT